MKLYVIRHGQTETNSRHCWTGWMDIPLTEKGRRDAEHARRVLADVKPDRVYASDLIRAQETARIVVGEATPVVTTPLLREIHVGSYEGRPFAILTPELDHYLSVNGYKEAGGESYAEFAARLDQFLAEVRALDCETVMAFTHGGTLFTFLDRIVGMNLPRTRFSCSNCTVVGFETTADGWRLFYWNAP